MRTNCYNLLHQSFGTELVDGLLVIKRHTEPYCISNNVNMVPTNLSIGDADESLVDQFVPQWVPGLALHDVTLCCFIGKRDGWYLTEGRETHRGCVVGVILCICSLLWIQCLYLDIFCFGLIQHAPLSKHETLDWFHTATQCSFCVRTLFLFLHCDA